MNKRKNLHLPGLRENLNLSFNQIIIINIKNRFIYSLIVLYIILIIQVDKYEQFSLEHH